MNTLNRLETVSGDYGLYIKVKYTDEIDTTASQEKTFNFSQNDMYGDVYNFTTYFSQEAVFDISDVGNITSIEAFLYQGSNFKRIKSNGDGKDNYELISNKIEYKDIDGKPYTTEMEPNIFVNNIEISLGYDLNNFDSDAVIVYTLNSTQYSSSDSAEARKREIQARWVHKTDDGFVSVEQDKLNEYNAQIHWYRYQLDEKATYDDFGGKYWVPIKGNKGAQQLDQNDIYKCYIECDPAVQDENVKAVISLPSAERNDYLQDVATELGKGAMVSTDEIGGLTKALKEAPNKLTNDDVLEQIQLLIDTYEKITNPNETQQKFLKYLNQIEEEISGLPCIDLYSDIVQIHNTTQVQARLAVDLVQAVSITVGDEKDPYKGVYMIYGENGEIMNSSISAQRQKLILSYGSLLTGLNEFDGDGTELVSWRFPLTNTMIRTPTEGIEYDNSQAIIYNEKGEPLKNKDGSYQIRTNRDGVPIIQHNGDDYPIIQYIDDTGATTNQNNATWAVIKRKIEKLKETNKDDETKIGGFATKTTEQIFRIKDYYTSVGRNTIYCEINKGGYIYVAEITLIFGVAGTSGTDYTLRIVPSKTAIDKKINLNTHVYDYNNQEVKIKSITYSFVSPNSLNNVLTEIPEDFPVKFGTKSGSAVDIEINGNSISTDKYYVIVKASAQIDTLDTYLTTFLPLSWSSDLSKYNHFEGPDKVIYSAQGSNPFYYKNNFVLYSKLDKKVSGITWSLEAYDTDLSYDEEAKQYKPAKKFYPSVLLTEVGEDKLNQKKYYSLKVPSMYIKENHLCRLVGKIKDDIIWIQPLYIAQNDYNSPLLNAWDENVSIDEEGGTIMAPMIGAGKKNADNQFSGVLMGDVKAKADNSVALTGLYGYQNGIQTFSLTEDGKAKFGASGSGQIQIDGKSGFIQSGNYVINKNTGMKIDLTDGKIDAYNFKLTSSKITINSAEDAEDYFTIKGSGKIKTISYDFVMDGDKPTPVVDGYKEEEVAVSNKVLINIGNNRYYLQTLNYNDSSKKEAGLKIDLKNGTLNAYSGFNLTAINPQIKVKVNDTTEQIWRGKFVLDAENGEFPLKLELGDTTPFKLSWAGYLYTTKLQATGGTIGSWYIDTNGLWSSKSSPKIQINKTGTISISIPNNEAYTLTSSNKDYTGPHILVGGRSGKFVNKVYDSIGSGELTKHEEGKFDTEDIGKYIQKNGSYYKIMRTTLDNTGSYYEQTYSGEGGIALTGDGTIAIENLYLKGGGGYWGGCAAYSTATTSTGHTHKISGTIKTATMCNTLWMRKLDGTVADDGSMKAYFVENYSVTCCYSGNTNSGITATYNGTTVTPNAGDGYATYYTSDAYTKMKKACETAKDNYDTATKKYYHAQDFKFGLTTKTIYAYRTGDRRVVLTDSYPGGIWVD